MNLIKEILLVDIEQDSHNEIIARIKNYIHIWALKPSNYNFLHAVGIGVDDFVADMLCAISKMGWHRIDESKVFGGIQSFVFLICKRKKITLLKKYKKRINIYSLDNIVDNVGGTSTFIDFCADSGAIFDDAIVYSKWNQLFDAGILDKNLSNDIKLTYRQLLLMLLHLKERTLNNINDNANRKIPYSVLKFHIKKLRKMIEDFLL
jgi:hypothetical protein